MKKMNRPGGPVAKRTWFDIIRGPKSLVIVGASNDPEAPGGRMLRHLREFDFQGQIHVVNPNRAVVQNRRAVPSVLDITSEIELAVVMVAAPLVMQVLRECVEQGVRVAIIGSSGFAEASDAGRAMQLEMLELSQQSGMRIIGPNCNGVTSIQSMLVGSTISLDEAGLAMTDDGVALVSQSGAIGGLIFASSQRSGLGIGLTVAIGNAVDIGLEEVLTEFANDSKIKVVLAYVEGIKRGADFIEAVRRLHQARKPIIILKAGSTDSGTRATISHTGAMAGEPRVMRNVFDALGIIQARSLTELTDIAQIEKSHHGKLGPSISVISMGGGTAVLTTDLIELNDLTLADWSDDATSELLELLPRATHQNPFDTGVVISDPNLLLQVLELADRQSSSDVTVAICAFLVKQEVAIADALANAARAGSFTKPLVIIWLGGSGYASLRLNSSGVPCFPDPARAINALGAIVHSNRSRLSLHDSPAHSAMPETAQPRRSDSVPQWRAHDSTSLLNSFGIATVEGHSVTTLDECSNAARSLGYPVALKLISEKLAHKSEAGAVRLDLRDEKAVRDEADSLIALKNQLKLEDGLLLVQKHLSGSLELILSMTTDESFGPVVHFGIGGVATELHHDLVHFLPQISDDDVPSIVDQLELKELIYGFRGSPPVDLKVLTDTITSFVSLVNAASSEFSEIEINPLLVTSGGSKLVALDTLFVERQ